MKRANELATIGNKKAALQVLHDVLTAKKSRTWVKVFEAIMFRYIDICVELQMFVSRRPPSFRRGGPAWTVRRPVVWLLSGALL